MQSILAKYDSFILDIWGVIHDGVNLLPQVAEFIDELISKKKTFCFLSNAPRPAKITLKKLHDLGLGQISIDQIVTSGDLFLNHLNRYSEEKIFVIGEEKNNDLLNGQVFKHTTNLNDARFILMLAFGFNENDLMQYNNLLEKAVALNIPMICPNPDIIVQNGGRICYTPGAYARIYENMKGEVKYFGKPYKEAFEFVFAKHSMDPAKTIMIGDSLETDIRGAKNAGIDSAMLLTGIHGHEKEIEELFIKHNLKPTYVLESLML